MDIFLVRHGEAAATWAEDPDPGLSELGLRQAHEVAEELAGVLGTEARLLSSPLQRARQTALPLAERLGKGVVVDDAFREIPAPVPLAQRQTWLRAFMRQQWEEQGDELHAWRGRAVRALEQAAAPSVVFSHFLVINAVVGAILDQPQNLVFWPDNGSITQLRLVGEGLQLVSLGRELHTRVN
jgi:probable phosphoglycerate mutase